MGAFLPKGIEWIIILVVVLLIFGPKNLPKLGAALGRTVKNLREGLGKNKKKANEAEVEVAEVGTADSDAAHVAETVRVEEVTDEPLVQEVGTPIADTIQEKAAGSSQPRVVKRTVVRKKVQE